jgi:hypothetical protein
MKFRQEFNSHKKEAMNGGERGGNKIFPLSRFRAEVVKLVCVLFWVVRLRTGVIN